MLLGVIEVLFLISIPKPIFYLRSLLYSTNIEKTRQLPPAEYLYKPIWVKILGKWEILVPKYWFSIEVKTMTEKQQVQTNWHLKRQCASPLLTTILFYSTTAYSLYDVGATRLGAASCISAKFLSNSCGGKWSNAQQLASPKASRQTAVV